MNLYLLSIFPVLEQHAYVRLTCLPLLDGLDPCITSKLLSRETFLSFLAQELPLQEADITSSIERGMPHQIGITMADKHVCELLESLDSLVDQNHFSDPSGGKASGLLQ